MITILKKKIEISSKRFVRVYLGEVLAVEVVRFNQNILLRQSAWSDFFTKDMKTDMKFGV